MSANRIDRAGQAALCAERACRRLWVALEAEVLSVWTDARRHGKDEISPGSSPTHRRTAAERERSEAMARVIGTDDEVAVGLPSCQFCGSRDEVSVGPFMRICAG